MRQPTFVTVDKLLQGMVGDAHYFAYEIDDIIILNPSSHEHCEIKLVYQTFRAMKDFKNNLLCSQSIVYVPFLVNKWAHIIYHLHILM